MSKIFTAEELWEVEHPRALKMVDVVEAAREKFSKRSHHDFQSIRAEIGGVVMTILHLQEEGKDAVNGLIIWRGRVRQDILDILKPENLTKDEREYYEARYADAVLIDAIIAECLGLEEEFKAIVDDGPSHASSVIRGPNGNDSGRKP